MKKLLFIVTVALLACFGMPAVAYAPAPINPSDVLNALLRQPQWIGDRSDGPNDRIALYWPVAIAIARVAKTPYQVAALIALSKHETHLARPVLEGHCDQMPRGQQCDGGLARGIYQLHREACPMAYAFQAGSVESLDAETACAIHRLGTAMKRCRDSAASPESGMFSGYRNGNCLWPPAVKRAASMQSVLRGWRPG